MPLIPVTHEDDTFVCRRPDCACPPDLPCPSPQPEPTDESIHRATCVRDDCARCAA